MKSYTDTEIYRGVLERDPKVIDFIYKNYLPIFLKNLNKNNRLYEEAEDIFQESIIVIYQHIQNNKINEETNFKSYFWSVFSNLTLAHNRKYLQNKINIDSDNEEDIIDEELNVQYVKNLRSKIYIDHFNRLKDECKKLLKLFFKKMSIKKIAKKLGYKNEQVVKVKKYKCKDELVESIKKDYRFNDVFD